MLKVGVMTEIVPPCAQKGRLKRSVSNECVLLSAPDSLVTSCECYVSVTSGHLDHTG